MRARSLAKELRGTVLEILGTAFSVLAKPQSPLQCIQRLTFGVQWMPG